LNLETKYRIEHIREIQIQEMNTLPQYIKNLISEFNVDHRDQMKPVLIELLKKTYEMQFYEYACWYCDKPKRNNNTNTFIFTSFRDRRYTFCSPACLINGEELIYDFML
jgi:hypothetical protein